jgi:hypothetical protein
MRKETKHMTTETGSEPMRATRRTVLRGAGVVGLLSMGVGTGSAQGQHQRGQPEAKEQAQAAASAKGVPHAKSKIPDSAFAKSVAGTGRQGRGRGEEKSGGGISG